MDIPKPKPGRPRAAHYRAHDARRARTYLGNARSALERLIWELQRNDDVLRYLYVERKADLQWAMGNARPMMDALEQLRLKLDRRVAAAEGLADGD